MSGLTIGIAEIDRKYEILEKMAEGGMGEIFKVRHRLLDEVRVIKTIRSVHRESPELQARFVREAKVATLLDHPGIAKLYDLSVDEDGTACIVMEFIRGTNLAETLRSGDRLSIELALEIAQQTLAALGYLHGKRVVHRDVSPDNIMLNEDELGRPAIKLIDLGIAKSLEGTQWETRTGTFIGKIKYASPEQLQRGLAGDIDARSDLYSFGVVLYELLTQQFPISGTDEASVLAGHLLQPPKDFAETDPDGRISPALRAVVLKALEKNPDHRIASAEEFARFLEEAARGIAPPVEGTALAAASSVAGPKQAPDEVSVSPTVMVGPGDQAAAQPVGREAPGRPRALSSRLPLLGGIGLAVVLTVAALIGLGGRDAPESGDDERPVLADLDFGTYHALVIGNDSYAQLPPLRTAANDARALGEVLERKYGFQVRVLTDASRYEMMTALTEIGVAMTARDNLLIYYAGHGYLDSTNQTGYWQPVDAEPTNTSNWISTKHEVSAVLGRVAARHILVVADSCYSGTLADGAGVVGLPDQGVPESAVDRRRQVEELLRRRSRLALTSGGLSPVLDQGDGTHSVFARVLLDVLEKNPDIVEISRLFEEIKRRVPLAAQDFGAEQDPQLASISRAGDEGGEFFFVPTALATSSG